jgi:hypothetical protein
MFGGWKAWRESFGIGEEISEVVVKNHGF